MQRLPRAVLPVAPQRLLLVLKVVSHRLPLELVEVARLCPLFVLMMSCQERQSSFGGLG